MRRLAVVFFVLAMLPGVAGAQYRPEYMLTRLDSLVSKAGLQVSDIDSILTMLTQPTVRQIDANSTTILAAKDITAAASYFCTDGVNVDGAVSADVVLTWEHFTGPIVMVPILGTTGVESIDTMSMYYDFSATTLAADSIRILSTSAFDTTEAGSLVLKVGPQAGADYMQGYLYFRIYFWLAADVENLYINVTRQY